MGLKQIFGIGLLLTWSLSAFAQSYKANDPDAYRRSSLTSVLIRNHSEFNQEIQGTFISTEIPDKYNNHDIGKKLVTIVTASGSDRRLDEKSISSYLDENEIAKALVAKWFNRSSLGTFDVSLVAERGLFDASEIDRQLSSHLKRGSAILADAGEDLIGNTFVIVDEIRYVNKQSVAEAVSLGLNILAMMADVYAASTEDEETRNRASSISTISQAGAMISDQIAGFTVRVISHLYRLDWNEEVASTFYNEMWCDRNDDPSIIAEKRRLFDNSRGLFRLEYVGKYSAKSQKTVLRNYYRPEDVIRKVCIRALDKNVAELQKRFEVFRVKIPITARQGEIVSAYIGEKEGITGSTRMEVLEAYKNSEGMMDYRRVGIVKAIPSEVWDNRYMVDAAESSRSLLSASSFQILSGGNRILPGMLLRETRRGEEPYRRGALFAQQNTSHFFVAGIGGVMVNEIGGQWPVTCTGGLKIGTFGRVAGFYVAGSSNFDFERWGYSAASAGFIYRLSTNYLLTAGCNYFNKREATEYNAVEGFTPEVGLMIKTGHLLISASCDFNTMASFGLGYAL